MIRKHSSSASSSGSGAKSPEYRELFHLVKKGRWDKIAAIIKSGRMSKRLDNSGLSPLALFVTGFAPNQIIQMMLKHDPEATIRTDEFGATPLHLACLNGTTAEIVKLILDHDKGMSARMVDQDQYTVLHHAVEYICLMVEKRKSFSSQGSVSIAQEYAEYLQIVQYLCESAPEMVFHTTKDSGDTPLDIPQVILSRHGDKENRQCQRIAEVHKILRKTGIQVYLKRKKEWEGLGDASKKKIESDSSIPSLESSNQSSESFTCSSSQPRSM